MTFRRSSTTTNTQSSSQGESALLSPSIETSEQITGGRYAKHQVLDLYNQYQASNTTNGDVEGILDPSWNPTHSNGTNSRSWVRNSDSGDNHGPYGCWDQAGEQRPISLEALTDAEILVSFSKSYSRFVADNHRFTLAMSIRPSNHKT